jgi:hypothetical protein
VRESLTGEELRGGVGAGAPRRRCGGAPRPRPRRDAEGLRDLDLAGVGLRGGAGVRLRGGDAEGLRGSTGVGLRGDDAKGLPGGAAKGLPAARRASAVRALRAGDASRSRGVFFFFYMPRLVLVGCRVKTIGKFNPVVGLSLDGGYQHARLIASYKSSH